MPTMMSACPRRAISSRMAGVKPEVGTPAPYHRRRHTAPRLPRQPLSAPRDLGGRPVAVPGARRVTAVRGLVGEAVEADGPPAAQPWVDRRLHEDADADELRLGEDGFEEPPTLEKRHVADRLVVQPEEVDDDERSRHPDVVRRT